MCVCVWPRIADNMCVCVCVGPIMNMRRGVCFKPVLAIHAPGTVFGRVFSRNDNRARIVLCVLYALHLTGIRCQHANRHTRAPALNKFACARTVNISPHTVDLFTSASFCVCTHTHNGYSNMLPPSYCAVFAFRPRYMFTYLRGIYTQTHTCRHTRLTANRSHSNVRAEAEARALAFTKCVSSPFLMRARPHLGQMCFINLSHTNTQDVRDAMRTKTPPENLQHSRW